MINYVTLLLSSTDSTRRSRHTTYTNHSTGTTISAMSQRKPTTHVRSSNVTSASAKRRPRSYATPLMEYATVIWDLFTEAKQIYGNWKWCSVDQQEWFVLTIGEPAASNLCCSNSSGRPFRNVDHRRRSPSFISHP